MIDSRSTVLVVDDTPENLSVLGELLAPLYHVRVAISGADALRIAVSKNPPDLILLDVMMPEMDGYEVLRRLRADERTRDIPIIFVTVMEDEERGLEMGAVDYITKPLRTPIVLARVRAHMELKKARDLLQKQKLSLEAEVSRRMGENLVIQDVSIRALANLAETRDPETGNHILCTQGYVEALARHLQSHPRFADFLTERTIISLTKSAPLHDIGKVGIPDHILLKPGKLTPDEWAIMKTHAKIGSDAIEQAEALSGQSVEFLELAKEIAHWHHERWDGTGYPDGLKGDAIPLSARLMAPADVFDALISRRVYKDPVPFEKAREIILNGRGSHFDPDVVDAFVAIFEEFQGIAKRQTAAAAPALPDAQALASQFAGSRVLLADDVSNGRERLRCLIEEAGLTVDAVENGARALEQIGKRVYDLVLMDMHMPVMDGSQSCRAIRKLASGAHVPIIALTSSAHDDDKAACLAAGMNDFLVRPADQAALYATLLKWLPAAKPSAAPLPAMSQVVSEPVDEDSALREALSGIAGLDVKLGLRSMMGNLKKYFKMLRRYIDSHVDDVKQMDALIAKGKLREAQRLIHTLKGLSGTLGVLHIQETAIALDALLKVERVDAALARQLATRLREFQQAIQAISPTEEGAPVAAATAAALEPSRKAELLAGLESLLAEDDIGSNAYLLKKCNELATALGPRYGELSLLVEGFRYAQALSLLRQSLGSP